jgi:hypothetical protein
MSARLASIVTLDLPFLRPKYTYAGIWQKLRMRRVSILALSMMH